MNAGEPGLARSLVRRSTRFVFLRAVTGGLSVLASLLLYRTLGPEQAGRFQFVLALGMTLGVLGGAGMMDTLARFVPERSSEAAAGLFRRALITVVLVSAGMGLLLWPPVALTGFPADAAHAVVILPVFALTYSLYTVLLGMFRGRGRLEILPLLDLGWNFGSKAAAIVAALSVPLFLPAFTAYTWASVAVLAGAFVLLRMAPRGAGSGWTGSQTRFAKLILAAEVLRILSRTVDVYMVRGLLGAEATGLFAAGVRVTAVVEQLVLTPIGVPLLYYFSHPASASLRQKTVENGGRVLGALMGGGALALAAAAGPVVTLLLGDQYLDSVPVARLYTGHAVGAALLVLLLPLYNSLNRPQLGIYQAGAVFLLTLGLDVILIPRFGVTGAALAGVVATALTAIMAAVTVHRILNVDIRTHVFRILMLYLVCYALVTWGWPLPALILYAVGAWLLRLVRRSDLELLKRPSAS